MRVRKYVCERDREKERDREWVSVFLCLYWSIILFDLLYYLPIKAARPHEGFPTNQPVFDYWTLVIRVGIGHSAQDAQAQDTTAHFVILGGRYGTFWFWGERYGT